MGIVATFTQQPLRPAFGSPDAQQRAVALPWGGPTNAGGPYAQGLALTLNPGTAQPEIWQLTVGGTGSFVMQVVANGVLSSATITNGMTPAQIQAALVAPYASTLQNPAGIFPSWLLPATAVTGSTGGPFTITFNANARLGMNVQFVTLTGSPNPSFSRTQRGSVGTGQYDVYDGVTYTTVNALLTNGVDLGITGGLSTIPYGPLPDATFPIPAFIAGYFRASDIPNLQNGAVAAGNIPGLTWHVGSSITQPGAIVKLTQ